LNLGHFDVNLFEGYDFVKSAGLYGSYAKGGNTEDSIEGRAESSVRAADSWLEESNMCLRNGASNTSFLSAYLAMFHSARVVLILDGYCKRSHYCFASGNRGVVELFSIKVINY